jgi:hypothetical protein
VQGLAKQRWKNPGSPLTIVEASDIVVTTSGMVHKVNSAVYHR